MSFGMVPSLAMSCSTLLNSGAAVSRGAPLPASDESAYRPIWGILRPSILGHLFIGRIPRALWSGTLYRRALYGLSVKYLIV